MTREMNPKAVSTSGQNYLEAVLMLQSQRGRVRSVDLAERLGVTKPSVSVAVHALEEAGYLFMDEEKFLHLTDAGMEIAEKIYEKHRFFTDALINLGVDPETAEADACKIEHDVSDETFAVLTDYCDKRRGARIPHDCAPL